MTLSPTPRFITFSYKIRYLNFSLHSFFLGNLILHSFCTKIMNYDNEWYMLFWCLLKMDINKGLWANINNSYCYVTLTYQIHRSMTIFFYSNQSTHYWHMIFEVFHIVLIFWFTFPMIPAELRTLLKQYDIQTCWYNIGRGNLKPLDRPTLSQWRTRVNRWACNVVHPHRFSHNLCLRMAKEKYAIELICEKVKPRYQKKSS